MAQGGEHQRTKSQNAPFTSATAQAYPWKPNYEGSLGSVIATCRRRGGISTVFKNLGMGKMEPNVHVNVGKERWGAARSLRNGASDTAPGKRAAPRKLGVSVLGGSTSKGCPTKSVENEDRYVHGKINIDMRAMQGLLSDKKDEKTRGVGATAAETTVPCWAFATFDGHAGPACAHYLKENFMEHLGKIAKRRKASGLVEAVSASADVSQGNADAAAGKQSSTEGSPVDATPAPKHASVEVVLARLLTDTLASVTRAFEKSALRSGEISGACAISGLYCEGALVLGNIGDCQAVYHGQVKSAPGSAVTAQTTIHDASNPTEVNRFLMLGGFMSTTGRFQGVLEPSRTIGDVDVKADAPKGCIASYPELFKVDIASEIFSGDENASVPPFLVMATDGIWDEASASTVVAEVKDGISKIQAHKRRFAISKGHHRGSSVGSMTFTDGESDSEDESEFCGSGEWAEHGMDLADRVVSLAKGMYDDATALVVVFE